MVASDPLVGTAIGDYCASNLHTGFLNAGLFFIAFVRNPETSFIPMQIELSRRDALNEYITHTGTALFAVPPGIGEGDESAYWGSTLLE